MREHIQRRGAGSWRISVHLGPDEATGMGGLRISRLRALDLDRSTPPSLRLGAEKSARSRLARSASAMS